MSVPLALLPSVLSEGLEGACREGKAQERRAMIKKGRRHEPSSACGWWTEPLWRLQTKRELELWPARPSRPPRRAAPSCVAKGGNLSPEPAETVLLQSRLVASSPSALSHSFCCSGLSHRGDWCKSLCVNNPSAANWRCWRWRWCPGGSVEAEVFCLPQIQRAPVCGWPCLHHSGSFPPQVLLQKSSSSPLFPAFPLALFPVGFQYAAVRSSSPCRLDGTPHF